MPQKQQFLVTKKVSCEQRIKDIEKAAQEVMEVDVGDGWVETNEEKKEPDAEECLDLEDDIEPKAQVVEGGDDEDVEEVVDLDDLEEGGNDDNIFASDKFVSKNADEDMSGIQVNAKLRKYDLSITYDYYH